MRPADRYHKFVEWSDDDQLYVGYCPDLFPFGGVCHAASAKDAYAELCEVVENHVAELGQGHEPLPPVLTRPMRELALA
jgi:predicted RNase H-like HicB family nuclease